MSAVVATVEKKRPPVGMSLGSSALKSVYDDHNETKSFNKHPGGRGSGMGGHGNAGKVGGTGVHPFTKNKKLGGLMSQMGGMGMGLPMSPSDRILSPCSQALRNKKRKGCGSKTPARHVRGWGEESDDGEDMDDPNDDNDDTTADNLNSPMTMMSIEQDDDIDDDNNDNDKMNCLNKSNLNFYNNGANNNDKYMMNNKWDNNDTYSTGTTSDNDEYDSDDDGYLVCKLEDSGLEKKEFPDFIKLPLVLATASETRKSVFDYLEWTYMSINPEIEEDIYSEHDVSKLVIAIAKAKTEDVLNCNLPSCVCITGHQLLWNFFKDG